jgi:c-di-GMP-binding flagellar brake protein YcgR
MSERRTARRYELSLPVIVRGSAEAASPHNGQTRDISTRGVYFMVEEDLAPGSELDFTLTLPAEITQGTAVFIRAHGKVVRVDRKQEDGLSRMGVAAVIEKYDIIRTEQASG